MPAHSAYRFIMMVVGLVLLAGCTSNDSAAPASQPMVHSAQATTAAPAATAGPRPTAAPLTPSQGQAIGAVYEGFLSPHQEPGEEEDTPALAPSQFKSTAPSVPRNERRSRGHGQIRFTKDLSKAFVDVQVEELNAADVVMFHIHCGPPDVLGPILIDFALSGSLQEQLADGVLSLEITNADLEKTKATSDGLVGLFIADCPSGEATTIAGLEHIAQQGELYFNLHTKGQTFYGDMRGQLSRAEP